MPRSTLEAYEDHGPVTPEVFGSAEISQAKADLQELAEVGVSYEAVTDTLEREGVEKFADSFHELVQAIEVSRLRYTNA